MKKSFTQHLIANNENACRCYPTWRISRLTTHMRNACTCVLKELHVHSPVWNPLWTWDTKPECCSKSCTPLATPCPPSIHKYWPVQTIQIKDTDIGMFDLALLTFGTKLWLLNYWKGRKDIRGPFRREITSKKAFKILFFLFLFFSFQMKLHSKKMFFLASSFKRSLPCCWHQPELSHWTPQVSKRRLLLLFQRLERVFLEWSSKQNSN